MRSLISISPNPFNDSLVIECPDELLDSAYVIIDSVAQQVLSGIITGEKTIVNTETLLPGIYIIHVEIENGHITKRIVKK